jgi:predicted GNAT family acetyltransferase
MGLRRADLREVLAPPGVTLRALTRADVPAALELYAHYEDNWFDAVRVEEGLYVGAEQDGVLVAVGGTHVVSDRTRAAALGDIVTAPAQRGRGLGTFLTHGLCERLFERVDLIVLNVHEANGAAQRAYAKVGFSARIRHLEGTPVRRAVSS